jgi:mannitol-1-phosphate 5-dehydrogenase
MPTLLQFGAGNIGRSFVAQLFSAAGFDVTFVDVADELVAQLTAVGRYRVMVVGDSTQAVWVERVRAIHGREREAVADAVATADIAATAVGPNALPYLYPTIALGLQRRFARFGLRPLDFILAENLRNAATIVRQGLQAHLPEEFPLEAMVGLAETSIGKMVPIMTAAQRAEDPLWVFAEPYNTLILDGGAFRTPIPAVSGLQPKAHMAAYVDRKLFVHNLGHAAVAYLGYLHDPQMPYIWQGVEVPTVRAAARAAMEESAQALQAAYPDEFTAADLRRHIDDLLRRFGNRGLGDTIFRVGRDLPRKLAREDRVIGAMLLAAAHDVPFTAIARVTAAALEFRATDEEGRMAATDVQFVETLYPQGLEAIATQVCGLHPDDPNEAHLVATIAAARRELAVGV